MVTVDQVLVGLRKVVDPELHKDIVSMGMVKDLSINSGKVSFTLELTTPACPFNSDIERDVRSAIADLGVQELDMKVTARVPEGRAVSMDELLPKVKNIIAVASGKGGVGKTTVSVNLAIALARAGAKVGLLDADIYGPSVPLMLGLKVSPQIENNKIQPPLAEGVKVISMGFFYEQSQQAGIYRGPIVSGIIKQFLTDVNWGELDYLIIDLPPGTGDAPLTIAQTIPITGILIITTPQDVAMNVAVKAIGMFNKLNVPIVGVLENMSYLSCPHCDQQIHLFGEGGGKRISEEFGIPFLGEIPLHLGIREGSDKGKPTVISEPESLQSQSFTRAAKLVAGRVSTLAVEMKQQDGTEGSSSVPEQSQTNGGFIPGPEERSELQKPFGVLIREGEVTREKLQLSVKNASKVISVGDATTRRLVEYGIIPDLAIIDGQERRQSSPTLDYSAEVIRCSNPAGMITDDALQAIRNGLHNSRTRLLVTGEEDLLALPACAYAPLESIVLYGQPMEGIVQVAVTSEKRAEAERLLSKMPRAH